MPKKPLSSSLVASAKPIAGKRIEYPDAKVPGLALRVSPSGAKSWAVRYRASSGRQQRYTIGSYPAVQLAAARTKALSVLASVAAGNDPAGERKASRAAERSAQLNTVGELATQYFEDVQKGRHRPRGTPKRQSTIDLERNYFDRLIAPKFGTQSISEPTRATIQAFINQTADKQSRAAAVQCRNVLRQLFSYAHYLELVQANPCAFVDAPVFKARERVLTGDELKAVWGACEDPASVENLHMSRPLGIAIQLAAVTLQRRGEVSGLQVDEIDFENRVWTIPGERTKNKRTHLVPLSDLALGLIGAAVRLNSDSAGHLFPSPRDADRPIDPHAVTRAFRRLIEAAGIARASPHDLRRTGATMLTSERIGVSRFVVSQVLNHTSDAGGSAAVTAVYDRHSYLTQKRHALDAWAAELGRIVTGAAGGSNIVSMFAEA